VTDVGAEAGSLTDVGAGAGNVTDVGAGAGNVTDVGAAFRRPDLDIRTDVAPADWDAYVERHPDASVYHLAAWTDLVREQFGVRAERLAVVRGGQIVGVLPLVFFKTLLFGRFATSMPFVNYGGIVADSPDVEAFLLSAAVDSTRREGGSYLELRHARQRFGDAPCQTRKVAMVLSLERTAEGQWGALDRKLRNQVRKAEKSGLTVRTGGIEDVGPFHDVLSENMRDLGTPVHGRRLFERILSTFPERSRLLSVWLGGTPVAASLVLWHRDRLEVPWASSVRRFNPLCANVLLYWEMLKFGIGKGFASFDFGRSTPQEGTFLFKQQWGAEPRQLYWEYWLADGVRLPDRSPANARFNAAVSAWRRLPVSITRVIGPSIVARIP
jgi:FemAB-related protein (PEP-CTERM system-associated)